MNEIPVAVSLTAKNDPDDVELLYLELVDCAIGSFDYKSKPIEEITLDDVKYDIKYISSQDDNNQLPYPITNNYEDSTTLIHLDQPFKEIIQGRCLTIRTFTGFMFNWKYLQSSIYMPSASWFYNNLVEYAKTRVCHFEEPSCKPKWLHLYLENLAKYLADNPGNLDCEAAHKVWENTEQEFLKLNLCSIKNRNWS